MALNLSEDAEDPEAPLPDEIGNNGIIAIDPKNSEKADEGRLGNSDDGEMEDDSMVRHSMTRQESPLAILSTKKEQERARMFRLMLLLVLAMTAGVTAAAFVFLGRQENENFETAVSQVSPRVDIFLSIVPLYTPVFRVIIIII